MLKPFPKLEPGDCLLYAPSDFFGWVTAIKTWNRVAHVEVYAGGGMSVASRNGIGVNNYPYRAAQLAWVLRPSRYFDFKTAFEWFNRVARGQRYDWLGLLCFSLAVKQGAKDKMFCSEFATQFYRAGSLPVFGTYSPDHVSPAQFLMTEDLTPLWKGE